MKLLKILPILIVIVLSSCERDDSEFVGPSLVNIFGDFSVLENFEISDTEINFATEPDVYFTATFSKQVDWEIHITGEETGAHKLIEGFSSQIDASNSIWNGSTTDLPLFNAEDCIVELRIPSDTVSEFYSLSIDSLTVADGFLITDFESGNNSGWDIFIQSGADMSFFISDDDISAQGNNYYDMGGEVGWDWLIGYIYFPATAFGTTTYNLNPNPTEVYFNVMLNVPEGISNDLILFQFWEDDNEDGSFSAGSEDMYSIELAQALEPGWQLVSLRYEDMVSLSNGQPIEPDGNGIKEPHKLNNVACLFLANPESGYSQVLMDYLIFTENSPLVP